MGFFDFLRSPKPSDLSDELFSISTKVLLGVAEIEFLKFASIDDKRYVTERTLMQTSHVLGLISYIAQHHKNPFFRDSYILLKDAIIGFYEGKKYFGFSDYYSLNRHVESYYVFDEPEKMFQRMFHSLRQEDWIIKNDVGRNILYTPVSLYVMGVRDCLRPFLKAFKV